MRPWRAAWPFPQMKETPLIRCAHNGHLHTVGGGRGARAGARCWAWASSSQARTPGPLPSASRPALLWRRDRLSRSNIWFTVDSYIYPSGICLLTHNSLWVRYTWTGPAEYGHRVKALSRWIEGKRRIEREHGGRRLLKKKGPLVRLYG